MKMPALFKTMIKHISIIACCLLLLVSSTNVNLRNIVAQDEQLTQTQEQEVENNVNEEVEENNDLSNEEEKGELVSNENNQFTEEVETVSNEMSQTTQEKEEVVSDEESQTSEEVETLSSEENEIVEKTNVEENVETVVEVNYPSFNESKFIDNITITVSAAEGVFPEGSYLYIEKVDNDTLKQVDDVINEQRNKDANVVSSYTFDIKVFDKDNNEVQPTDNNSVKVSFKLQEVENNNLDAQVYHVSDIDLSVEQLNVENGNDTLVVETESFSYYTVEFTYNNLQYVLQGDESIELNTVLETLGLSGEVSSVTVSDKTLFDVVNENGKWIVHSYKAFTSTEWMKVTIDEVVYEIVVTDDQAPTNITSDKNINSGVTWEGNFTIGNNGVVLGPQSGTGTVSGSTVTNNAKNGRAGGISGTDGSTFISRNGGTLVFDGVTINTNTKSMVFNIWQNATVNVKDSTLNGNDVDYGDLPFILVGGTNGPGTLNFNGDNTITNTNAQIRSLHNNSKVNVQSGTLTIKDSDIDLVNTTITVKSGATLVFDNSTFEQTTPSIVLEDGATLKLINGAEFTTIPNAGVFAIGNNVTLEVDGGSKLNVGVNAGITVAESGILRVTNGSVLTLSGNYGNTTGINNKGTVEIDSSTLVPNNTGVSAITNSGTVTINNSIISNSNKPGINGGVINSTDGTVTLTDSTFENNKAQHGGVVYATGGKVVVDGSTFNSNSASNNGGAIYINGATFTLENAPTFESNRAKEGGAIYISNANGTLNISEETTFTDNTANNKGGAIAAYNTNIDIKDTDFTSNGVTGDGDGQGGAIYVKGAETFTIDDNTTFVGNWFTGDDTVLGGAIYLCDVEDGTIGKALFTGNGWVEGKSSKSLWILDGAAMYVTSDAGTTELKLNGTQFIANHSWAWKNSSAGAIYIGGKTATEADATTKVWVHGAKFLGNIANTYGGAVVVNNSHAKILDLDGDPTEFIENLVEYGADHAGGGLFINGGYATLWDAAIYDNYAKDGGGGISTCTKGTAQAKVLDGAAIFNNHVFGTDEIPMGTEYGVTMSSDFVPPAGNTDIKNYPDIYFQTKDHLNSETGKTFQPDDNFPTFPFELYERMFNGGLHRWNAKPFASTNDEVPPTPLNSLMAKSNPNNKDISGAKVIFTQNVATNRGVADHLLGYTVTGGAIGSNGLLTLGNGTEIKIVKVWDDERNNDGYRPDMNKEFLNNLIVKADDNPIDISAEPIITEIVNIKDFDPIALANNIVKVEDPQKDYSDYDAWVLIISGLKKYNENDEVIKYTIEEKDQEYYSLIENNGGNDTFFEMKNKHNIDLVNISVSKVWYDSNNQNGTRPASITVRLYADGEEIDKANATPSSDWKVNFNDLPRYKNGKEITYTISEDSVYGYSSRVQLVSSIQKTDKPDTTNNKTVDEELDNDKIEELDQPIAAPYVEQIVVEKEFVITNIENEKPKYQVPKTGIE